MEMYIYILVVRLYITCVRKIHIHIYNKIFNPLVLLVGVGDCRGQCPGIGPVSPTPTLKAGVGTRPGVAMLGSSGVSALKAGRFLNSLAEAASPGISLQKILGMIIM